MMDLKTISIKGKDYVQVNERIRAFRTMPEFKGWRMNTEIIHVDSESVLMKASIINELGEVVATGHAQEYKASSYINKTSFIENCETSACGRALGNLGIGVDTSVASAEEVLNAINNQTKMIDDKQIFKIEDLLLSAQIPDKHNQKIYSEMSSYSYDQAEKCIEYLLKHQPEDKDVIRENGTGNVKQMDAAIKQAIELDRT